MSIHESLKPRGPNAISGQDTTNLDNAQRRKTILQQKRGLSSTNLWAQEIAAKRAAEKAVWLKQKEHARQITQRFLETEAFQDCPCTPRRFAAIVLDMTPDARVAVRTIIHRHIEGTTLHERLVQVDRVRTLILGIPLETGTVRNNLHAISRQDLSILVEEYCERQEIPPAVELLIQLDLPRMINRSRQNHLLRTRMQALSGRQIRMLGRRSSEKADYYGLDHVFERYRTDQIDEIARLMNSIADEGDSGQVDFLFRDFERREIAQQIAALNAIMSLNVLCSKFITWLRTVSLDNFPDYREYILNNSQFDALKIAWVAATSEA